MESNIVAIQDLLSKQDHAPTPSLPHDNDIYRHIKALAETAEDYASDASVVMGNASSSATVKAFPVRRHMMSGAITRDDVPTYASAAASVFGKPQRQDPSQAFIVLSSLNMDLSSLSVSVSCP